jgi:hypothetical protein
MSFNCKAKCTKCNGGHHKLCCKKFVLTKPQSGSDQDHVTYQSASEGTQTAFPEGETFHTTMTQMSSVSAVFQLANVEVLGHNNKLRANVLFDGGSDHSYVTTSLVKRLGPTFLGSKTMSYAPFGGGQTKPMERNVFKIRTKGVKFMLALRAVEVPLICASLRRCRIPSNILDGLEGSDLAFDYRASTDQNYLLTS